MDQLERKLRARVLLDRRLEDDGLRLDDATLRAALAGSARLTPQQAALLQASPLTLRRFRQLALERRARAPAANGAHWAGSAGWLRAAAHGPLERLQTDDGWWHLEFLNTAQGWRLVLRLDPQAPFAAALLSSRAAVEVCDGSGAVLLSGGLDADGELEAAWPGPADPAAHLQHHGAQFAVRPEVR